MRKSIFYLAAIPVVTTALSINLPAQTLFEWPDSQANLAEYSYIDNCASVHKRVLDSIVSDETFIEDTAYRPRMLPHERPNRPKAIESIRECLSRYTPDQITRDYVMLAHAMFLDAHNFEYADQVVRRGLTLIPSTDTSAAALLLDSVVLQTIKAAPFQHRTILEYLSILDSYGSVYRDFFKARAYTWLLMAARSAGNDSIADQAAKKVLETVPLAQDVDAAEKAALGISVAIATRHVMGREMLETLRTSTSAYGDLIEKGYKQFLGFVPPDMDSGKEAPILNGDFWYPATASSGQYPATGRVSLVVFIPGTPSISVDTYATITAIRRMAQRYPDVDLVLVSNTWGHFGPLEPPDSDHEAKLIDSLMRNFHKLPNSILTVTKGDFIQLQDPDGRRVYLTFPNKDAYMPSALPTATIGVTVFLVDQDRKIVDRVSVTGFEEAWTVKLIDVLLERNSSRKGN